jgi:hypothetical protein
MRLGELSPVNWEASEPSPSFSELLRTISASVLRRFEGTEDEEEEGEGEEEERSRVVWDLVTRDEWIGRRGSCRGDVFLSEVEG